MNNTSLKLILIFLLSLILIGVSLYFYNEHRKKQIIKNALVEFAQDLNSNYENNINNVESIEAPSISNEQSKAIEPSPQNFLPSKPASCQIELAGQSIYEGSCNFKSSGGGSFSITGFDIKQSLIGHVQEISVEVEKESKNGIVFGSNNAGSIHEWGQAKRSKGCWIGSNFKVCAYAVNKESSTEKINKPILKNESVKEISKEEELEHVRKVLDKEDISPEAKIIVYCTRKAEIYHSNKDMQEIEFSNCVNNLNPNY